MKPRIPLASALSLVCLLSVTGCIPPNDGPNPTTTTDANSTAASVVPASAEYFISAPASVAALLAAAPAADSVIDPLDWTYARGPRFDGHSAETGLVDDWNPDDGTNVLWSKEEFGARGTPIVMNGKLYTLLRAEPETPREGERVVCLDANTGELLWENRFNVWLSDVPDTRVGWSSVVGDPTTGNVYALGVCGLFQCLNGETGERIWSIPLHENFGLLSTYGGRTNFPIICDDLVIISAIVIGWGDQAKPAHRFIGFDKSTGEVVWFNGTRPLPYDTTYSAPILANVNGQKLLIFGSGDGAVWAIQPRTGKHVWKYQFSKRGLNVSPIYHDGVVYASHSEENVGSNTMGSVVAIDATKTGDISKTGALWKVDELMVGKSAPILIDGRLYCFDDRAKLHVLDAKTGEAIVSRKALGTVMRANSLYADGKIYANTANGRWYIIKPTEDGIEFLSKGRLPRGSECLGSPICSHGKVYLPTTGGLYCLADKTKQAGVNKLPALAAENDVAADQTPAQIQIIPNESLLKPGDTQKLSVRVYNANGQYLKDTEAEFSVAGVGTVAAGVYTANADASHQAGTITAKVGNITSTARVRVVPPLPWSFDFEGLGDPPVTWVGARYRHVIREVDGSNVMVKITTIPKGTRSRCWFGQSDLTNYTIQADVKGAIKDNKMPDIGLIAQGYALVINGASQELEIRSWVTQKRMAKTLDFDWKPATWYTMKLQTSVEDDKAVLRGKIWLKDQDEPQTWTVLAIDESPNLSGSPGLFGSAKDAELYLDNIKVYQN